jgi:hypothetical protein
MKIQPWAGLRGATPGQLLSQGNLGQDPAAYQPAAQRRSWPITGPIFSGPLLSDPVPSCLAGDLRVRRFVPESRNSLVSSESDSAALAPLQQDFCVPVPRPALISP